MVQYATTGTTCRRSVVETCTSSPDFSWPTVSASLASNVRFQLECRPHFQGTCIVNSLIDGKGESAWKPVRSYELNLETMVHIGLDILDLPAMEPYRLTLPPNTVFLELLDGFYALPAIAVVMNRQKQLPPQPAPPPDYVDVCGGRMQTHDGFDTSAADG